MNCEEMRASTRPSPFTDATLLRPTNLRAALYTSIRSRTARSFLSKPS